MKPKTLEETIRGLEICSGTIDYCDECPYKTSEKIKGDQTCDEYEVPLMMSDALYYLEQYKEKQISIEEEKRYYAEYRANYEQAVKDLLINRPLAKKEYSSPDGCLLCGNCGCYADETDEYCRSCGSKFEKNIWEFVGDNMFKCPHCGELYTLKQFQYIKNHTNDPDFPNFCPHCGSHNYKENN